MFTGTRRVLWPDKAMIRALRAATSNNPNVQLTVQFLGLYPQHFLCACPPQKEESSAVQHVQCSAVVGAPGNGWTTAQRPADMPWCPPISSYLHVASVETGATPVQWRVEAPAVLKERRQHQHCSVVWP